MKTTDVIAGAGAGAALAYFLDVDRGRARRSLVRHKLAHAGRVTRNGLDVTARDLTNRASGLAAQARSRFVSSPTSDEKLEARVRSVLGRHCSHPRAIDVIARAGEIVLRGPILAHEEAELLFAVASTRGVRVVMNELDAHTAGDGHPALQGPTREEMMGSSNGDWSPTAKALLTVGVAAGIGLTWYAARQRRYNGSREEWWQTPSPYDRSGN